jgi:hypothetical protein
MPVQLKLLLLLLSGNISPSLLGATRLAPSAAPAVFCAFQGFPSMPARLKLLLLLL